MLRFLLAGTRIDYERQRNLLGPETLISESRAQNQGVREKASAPEHRWERTRFVAGDRSAAIRQNTLWGLSTVSVRMVCSLTPPLRSAGSIFLQMCA
jgi:hypothetical protein